MAEPIPPRSTDPDNPPLTGTQIAQRIQTILGDTRSVSAAELNRRRAQVEDFVFQQFREGNVPDFMRPANYREVTIETQSGGRTFRATVRVCPDYLAIGSSTDFIRVPINPLTARRIADRFGLTLPTPRLVDSIDAQARSEKATDADGKEHNGMIRFIAAPEIARRVRDPDNHNKPVHDKWNYKKYGSYEGRWMLSPEFLVTQSRMMDEAFTSSGNPAFRSGSKKDVVFDILATQTAGEGGMPVVIYRPGVQPLSNIHNELYWDYSHGIRFLASDVEVTVVERDGSRTHETLSMRDVLMHRDYYRLFAPAQMDIDRMYTGTQAQQQRTQVTPTRREQPAQQSGVQFGQIEIQRQAPRQTH
ncbi:MAG TPA: hypothetical protein VLD37_05600 [Candidatus Bilamarchaeum sp.]|nr:hypothetical protein [Candidatus Bilamarchaeum sp.]